MMDSQPKHWDRSFERVSIALFVVVGLFFLTLIPALFNLILLLLVGALVIAVPVAIGLLLWHFLRRLYSSQNLTIKN